MKGVIINKFRGDIALLYSGIEQIEALTGVPVLGVLPWLEVDLEDEDSVALQKGKYLSTAKREIDIAVVQLPHTSNFTDFNALAAQPDVRVRYVRHPQELAQADLVILPGSKIRWAICCGCATLGWRRASCRHVSRGFRCWGSAAAIKCWVRRLSMRWNPAWGRSPASVCSIP